MVLLVVRQGADYKEPFNNVVVASESSELVENILSSDISSIQDLTDLNVYWSNNW